MIDAVRPKNLSLFGYSKETDKNIKRIAKQGIVFTNHFSVSNSTIPSITALFSGKYPNNNGIIRQIPYTRPEEIQKIKKSKFSLPNYLRNKGYNTIGIDWIGLWLRKGFNYYEEKKEAKRKKILNIPFIKKILLGLPNWAYKLGKKVTKVRASAPFSNAEKSLDLAIDQIKKSKKPFFVFVHLWDTHFPFPTIKNHRSSGKNDIKELLKGIKNENQKDYLKKRIADINLYSIGEIQDKYDLAMKYVDDQIGRFYDFLEKSKKLENTILIITSDHGCRFSNRGIHICGQGLYDEVVHVPLIIRWPKIKGKKINELVQNVDITASILDYLGAKEKIDGISFLQLIKGGKSKKLRDKVFLFDALAEESKAIRTDNKKLILSEDNKCFMCKSGHLKEIEEYDLEKDPEEKKNIYSGKSKLSGFLK
jgi:arylsulfatase A-like enzyme